MYAISYLYVIGRRVEIMKTKQTCSNKTEEGRA